MGDAEIPANAPPSATQRLLHRWFVEYNPFYLLSAMLVLVGMTALAHAAAQAGSGEGAIGPVPIISELYAFSLIAGAALLVRIGQRRPAVMLGLLTVVYQGDLTLLTERQLDLGAGVVVAHVWLGLFAVKLFALARAFRLRPSTSFVTLAMAGGFGLVELPQVIKWCHLRCTSDAGEWVSAWLFALVAAVLWTRREVTSNESLSTWEATVLRRSLIAVWGIWAAALALHLKIWSLELGAHVVVPVAALLLLLTHFTRREPLVLSLVGASAVYAHFTDPEHAWLSSLLAAAVLARRAFLASRTVVRDVSRPSAYRERSDAEGATTAATFTVVDTASQVRYAGASLVALWLAVSDLFVMGGGHNVVLDLALAGCALGLALRTRQVQALLFPALVFVHLAAPLVLRVRLTVSQWGMVGVALGFALLGGSLAVGYRLREAEKGADVSQNLEGGIV